MTWLSADEIRTTTPQELGQGGFCFIVAEILLERFPDATLLRLTSPAHEYGHVFLAINGAHMDIGGFRDVVADARFRFDDRSLEPEPVSAQAVRSFFYPKYNTSQLSAARETLKAYIDSRPERFRLTNPHSPP